MGGHAHQRELLQLSPRTPSPVSWVHRQGTKVLTQRPRQARPSSEEKPGAEHTPRAQKAEPKLQVSAQKVLEHVWRRPGQGTGAAPAQAVWAGPHRLCPGRENQARPSAKAHVCALTRLGPPRASRGPFLLGPSFPPKPVPALGPRVRGVHPPAQPDRRPPGIRHATRDVARPRTLPAASGAGPWTRRGGPQGTEGRASGSRRVLRGRRFPQSDSHEGEDLQLESNAWPPLSRDPWQRVTKPGGLKPVTTLFRTKCPNPSAEHPDPPGRPGAQGHPPRAGGPSDAAGPGPHRPHGRGSGPAPGCPAGSPRCPRGRRPPWARAQRARTRNELP